MKKMNSPVLIILLSGLFLTVLSVPYLSAQTLPVEKYLFFEKITNISGPSDQPFMYLDFPTYTYDTTAQSLHSQGSLTLTDQTQVVYGSGMTLSADVGMGASTQLGLYDNLTEPDVFSADTGGVVQYNLDGTWLTINPGQTLTETVETNEYKGFKGELIVTHTIRNFGIWDKANFTSQLTSPAPTEESTPSPDITPTPTPDITATPDITPTPDITENPTPVITPTAAITTTPATLLLGDVTTDGSVDIVDALLVAQFFVGLVPTGFNEAAADVNCDGNTDIVDALLIAQYYVGLIDQFC